MTEKTTVAQMKKELLEKEREKTEDTIMRYLTGKKIDYIEKCKYCGRMLPVGYMFKVCDKCYGE